MNRQKLIDIFPTWYTGAIFTRLGSLHAEAFPWASDHGLELDQMYFGNHSGDKSTSVLIDKLIGENDALTDDQISTLVNIIHVKYNEPWKRLYAVLSADYNPINNYDMVEVETPDLTRVETPNITKVDTPDITRVETPDITTIESPNVTQSKTTTTESDYSVTTQSEASGDTFGFNSATPVPQSESKNSNTVTTKGAADANVSTDTMSETGTRTSTESGTRTSTESGTTTSTETGTRTYTDTGTRTLTRSGNIGVTTSQQMLESEIELWKWSFFETIFRDVDSVLTSPVYIL